MLGQHANPERLFLRRRLALDRRQRLDVSRDRVAVGASHFRGVAYYLDHAAADTIGIGRLAVFQRSGDVGFRPLLELELSDVGNAALAVGTWTAGETQARDHAAERVARGVTFRAMAGSVHEISAAVPCRRLRGI